MNTEGQYIVYYLYSEKINKFYIGKTNDLQRRLFEHNNSSEKYTQRGTPWKFVNYIICKNNSDATIIENKLKKARNKKYTEWYFNKHGTIQ